MIVAIDFDGILCANEFPAIGEPNYKIISYTRQLIDAGVEVVLWTSRTDNELKEAIAWCEDYGLHFSAVNENAPSNIKEYESKYPNGTRKVYADYYIDDHNLEFRFPERGVSPMITVVRSMEYLINRAKRGINNEQR